MTYQTAVQVNRSGNIWIDGLTDGYRWGTTTDHPAVGYTFISNTESRPGGEFGGYRSLGWTQQERQLILDAMRDIQSVSGLRFVDRGDDVGNEVEIWFYMLDDRDAKGSLGFAYTPGSDIDEGLVAINRSVYEQVDGRSKGSIARGGFGRPTSRTITFLEKM